MRPSLPGTTFDPVAPLDMSSVPMTHGTTTPSDMLAPTAGSHTPPPSTREASAAGLAIRAAGTNLAPPGPPGPVAVS